MRLNTKLTLIMLSLLVLALCALFALNQYSRNDLVREIRESSTEISKAIQISVEDLTDRRQDIGFFSPPEFPSPLHKYTRTC